MKSSFVVAWFVLFANLNSVLSEDPIAAAGHQTKSIEGWTVLVSDQLFEKDKVATGRALELLTVQLQEIVRVVPAAAVVELRKVPLWFSPEYPDVKPRAEYHPGAGWLRDNKRDPAMEKAVEFTNVRIFERETKRMPNFALHELAHAYHDRVLRKGFGNEEIKAAFEKAKTAGLYERVEQRFGDGRSANVRAYAITSPMEYFAECSEAFFSTNDFFPFTREQLAKHDPTMFALLTRLWGEPAESPKPVKVFILAGQSNMEGHGFIAAEPKRNGGQGSLEFLVKDAATAKRFAHLAEETGQWRMRDDVWISYLDRKGPLTVGYGARKELIGPELGFGWVVGDALAEPVLLIKCAWGGKSLAVDFRPPSAGKMPYSLGETQDAAVAQDPAIVGKYYRETLTLTKAALANVKDLVHGSDGRYVIAGFGWHQGWNDRINDKFNAEYESNMSHFIDDIRKDLGVPALPFVIAETGMSGPEEKHPRALSLMKAQAAVAERPEFQGNVAFVGTKAFWRPQDVSPSGQSYHWNTNAETYYLIGEAMGEAMKRLLAIK
ncbi:MAG: sialate O-acetylesterase [Planctomycetaceae bacterium]